MLSIILEEQDVIEFNPNFPKLQSELVRIIENQLLAIQNMPRIEGKLYTELRLSDRTLLTPAIPNSVVKDARNRICALLEDQRVGPELRLQDFDKYIDLMNGRDSEHVALFMASNPPFDDFCEKYYFYREKEAQILKDIFGVLSMGLYEFHRNKFITNLELFARYMQEEILERMVNDQQAEIIKLGKEYENIAKKALTVPKDTAELMSLKAFVINTEENVIPEMEQLLRVNMNHILWLMDHTIFTPLQIKTNSNTFQWYLKMQSVFDEHRLIIADKVIEYQEALKKRIEAFRRELQVYYEQVQAYPEWGDIKSLSRYKKRSNVLDSRLVQAMETIDRINEEETSFGWDLSQYPVRKKAHDFLKPYKTLYDAGQEFMDKRDLWLNSQVGSFDPDEIDSDVSNVYRIVQKLEKQLAEKPQTALLCRDVSAEIYLEYLFIFLTLCLIRFY